MSHIAKLSLDESCSGNKRWSGYDRYAIRRSIYLSESDPQYVVASLTLDSSSSAGLSIQLVPSRFQFPPLKLKSPCKGELEYTNEKKKSKWVKSFINKRKRIDEPMKILNEVATCKFKNFYELTDTELGRGVSGAVYLVRKRLDGEYLAAKAYVKKPHKGKYNKTKFLSKIASEVTMLSQLHHDNVIRTLDIVTHQDQIITIMEFCPVNLFRLVKDKVLNGYDIHEYFGQLGAGVAYLHECGIAHRDLKLENLGIGQDGQLKILDFGSAINVHPNHHQSHGSVCPNCPQKSRPVSRLSSTSSNTTSSSYDHSWSRMVKSPIRVKGLCGSDPYIAPEIWESVNGQKIGSGSCKCCRQCGYDPFKSDIWSLGVIYISMHSGKFPWAIAKFNDLDFNLFKSNRRSRLQRFKVPQCSLRMLLGMLALCPEDRFNIDQVMSFNR